MGNASARKDRQERDNLPRLRRDDFRMSWRTDKPGDSFRDKERGRMTVKEFAVFRAERQRRINKIQREIAAEQNAIEPRTPPNLRAAVAEDIKVGAIVWYKYGGEFGWKIVDAVISPAHRYRGFLFRNVFYGLEGAFVEAEETV
jgi:hypothetical protein